MKRMVLREMMNRVIRLKRLRLPLLLLFLRRRRKLLRICGHGEE